MPFVSGKVHIEVSGDKDFKVDSMATGSLGGYAAHVWGKRHRDPLVPVRRGGQRLLTTAQLATSGEVG
jgi:hypothetical protein